MYGDQKPFSTLVGLTLSAVEGARSGGEEIIFRTSDGRTFRMFHDQDCCESVSIEDVAGDVADLIGSPILVAEERSSSDDPKTYGEGEHAYSDESHTWTFYELATVKGSVTIRWYGSSNGYYSEGVSFEEPSA